MPDRYDLLLALWLLATALQLWHAYRYARARRQCEAAQDRAIVAQDRAEAARERYRALLEGENERA